MHKCDFCTESRLKDGVLICPYNRCNLTEKHLLDIANALSPKVTVYQNNNTEEK